MSEIKFRGKNISVEKVDIYIAIEEKVEEVGRDDKVEKKLE